MKECEHKFKSIHATSTLWCSECEQYLEDVLDAELTKLKSDVARLRGPQEFILQRITTPMSFAVKVEIAEDKDGRIFKFVDHTGHAHGYFQERNPLSSVPENVAGVSKYDGWWFWIIRALEETK